MPDRVSRSTGGQSARSSTRRQQVASSNPATTTGAKIPVAAKGRKETQRERLLGGMVTAANEGGYAGANVSDVIREAGVSRPTFYDYFSDRDDCFVATIVDVRERLLASVAEALVGEASEDAMTVAVAALIQFADSHPAEARFAMSEVLGGGSRALDARQQGIAAVAALVETCERRAAKNAPIPDLQPELVLGGIERVLAARLRKAEPHIERVREDLIRWVDSYARPAGDGRWRKFAPHAAVPRSPHVSAPALRAPPTLPPGRRRMSEREVAQNHRQRILFAVAQLAASNGYHATTIAEITRLARIDGRAFYALFPDKRDAFMTLHEMSFQYLMAVTAEAFFGAADWPERSWEAGRALTQVLQDDPLIANVWFVEGYAIGPGAVQRVEDSHFAFTVFLQEGFRYAPPERQPSRLALEAIVASIFELLHRQTRGRDHLKPTGLLAQMMFMWLAPFMGAADADAFLDQKLADL